MKSLTGKAGGRRSFLKGIGGALGAGFWADQTLDALPQNVNTNSKPSALKITDLRVLTIRRAPMTCPIIRIDTNQGVYGLGEDRKRRLNSSHLGISYAVFCLKKKKEKKIDLYTIQKNKQQNNNTEIQHIND